MARNAHGALTLSVSICRQTFTLTKLGINGKWSVYT